MKLNQTKLFGRKNDKGYFVALSLAGKLIYDQSIIALVVELLDDANVIDCIENDRDFDFYI